MREAKTCIITCGLPINCVRACLPKPKPNVNIMIEHQQNETTKRNQRNVNQSANHSPSPLDSNSIPTTRQHAINSTTRQQLIQIQSKRNLHRCTRQQPTRNVHSHARPHTLINCEVATLTQGHVHKSTRSMTNAHHWLRM